MAVELATGYINLVPSARGMKEAIQKELGDAGVSGGAIASRGYSSKFKSGLGNLAGFAATTLKTGLAAGGVAGGALLATALKGGYDRLVTMQNATRALTIQLGDSKAAAQLLSNVLKVVQGTPFKLDQFSSAAQQMSAMGIEASKIPGILTAIGDVAATKGSDAGQYVDRLTVQFGQIHAQGKIMGQDLLQLAQAGVPALQILANHFGENTSEMQKMVSKGLVPASQAIPILTDAIEHGSGVGADRFKALAGTAKALGDTTSGAVSNAKIALSRLGVALLLPAFNAAPKVLGRITEGVDALTRKVGPMLTAFTQSAGFKNFFASLGDAFSRVDLGALMQRIGTVITGTLVPAFTRMAQQLAPLIPRVVQIGQTLGQIVVTAVQRLAPVLAALVPWVVKVGVAFGGYIVTALHAVVPPLSRVVEVAGDLIRKVPAKVVAGIAAAFGGFVVAKAGVGAINNLAGSVKKAYRGLVDAKDAAVKFGGAVKNAGSSVASAGKALAGGAKSAALWAKQGLVAAANWVKATATLVAQKVALLATAAAQKIATAAQWLLNAAMDANPITLIIIAILALIAVFVLAYNKIGWFRDFVQAAFRLIKSAISAVVDWVKTNWPLLLAILTGPIGVAVLFITRNWDTIKAGFTAVKDWIGARVSDVVGFITSIPGRIAGVASSAFNVLKDGISSAKNWVFDRVTDIVNAVLGIPGKIGSLATALLQAGKDLMTGLVNGIKAAPNAIIDALKEVAKHVPGPIKEILKHVPVVSDLFKAEGGPVLAGQPYIVGEKGPELFVPKVPGRIVPNGQLPSAASIQPAAQPGARGSSEPSEVTVVVPVSIDAREVTRAVGRFQLALQ